MDQDLQDNIIQIAQSNAKGCHAIFDINMVNKKLPFVKLNKHFVIPFNHHEHPATTRRLHGIISYFSKVIPHMLQTPCGYYNVELYDIYARANYRLGPEETNFNNVFCFARRKEDHINPNVPLMPDYYFMQNWNDRYVNATDTWEWSNKLKKIMFVGSTTGEADPNINERVQACLWSVNENQRDTCHFYISDFVRMLKRNVLKNTPELKPCVLQRIIKTSQQMQYKYLLNIDGDTCRWVPDVYFMNTLHFQTPSKDELWYSPLLKDKTHYIEVTFNKDAPNYIMKMYEYFENNPNEAQEIILNAKTIGSQLFTKEAGILYTSNLLDSIIANSAA
jgi:hypothetical protein